MRVLVRDFETGFYYAGPQHWVPDPSRAVDFKEVERATRFEQRAQFQTEVVLDYSAPGLRSPFRSNIVKAELDLQREDFFWPPSRAAHSGATQSLDVLRNSASAPALLRKPGLALSLGFKKSTNSLQGVARRLRTRGSARKAGR